MLSDAIYRLPLWKHEQALYPLKMSFRRFEYACLLWPNCKFHTSIRLLTKLNACPIGPGLVPQLEPNKSGRHDHGPCEYSCLLPRQDCAECYPGLFQLYEDCYYLGMIRDPLIRLLVYRSEVNVTTKM